MVYLNTGLPMFKVILVVLGKPFALSLLHVLLFSIFFLAADKIGEDTPYEVSVVEGMFRHVARPRGPYQLHAAVPKKWLAYASPRKQVKVARNVASIASPHPVLVRFE